MNLRKIIAQSCQPALDPAKKLELEKKLRNLANKGEGDELIKFIDENKGLIDLDGVAPAKDGKPSNNMTALMYAVQKAAETQLPNNHLVCAVLLASAGAHMSVRGGSVYSLKKADGTAIGPTIIAALEDVSKDQGTVESSADATFPARFLHGYAKIRQLINEGKIPKNALIHVWGPGYHPELGSPQAWELAALCPEAKFFFVDNNKAAVEQLKGEGPITRLKGNFYRELVRENNFGEYKEEYTKLAEEMAANMDAGLAANALGKCFNFEHRDVVEDCGKKVSVFDGTGQRCKFHVRWATYVFQYPAEKLDKEKGNNAWKHKLDLLKYELSQMTEGGYLVLDMYSLAALAAGLPLAGPKTDSEKVADFLIVLRNGLRMEGVSITCESVAPDVEESPKRVQLLKLPKGGYEIPLIGLVFIRKETLSKAAHNAVTKKYARFREKKS